MPVDQLNKRLDRYIDINEKAHKDLNDSIDLIKDNHLAHMKEDINTLDRKVTEVSTNVSWMMKFFWIVATASVGGLIAGVLNLILV